MTLNKRLLSIACAFVIVLSLIPATAFAAAPTINATSVKLYVQDESYKEYLSIPASYAQSFQLVVKGTTSKPTYKVRQGSSVVVSANGLIEPAKTVWYKSSSDGGVSFWTSEYIEGADTITEYEYGTSTIRVTVGTTSFDVKVTVYDYAETYVEKVMDDYIADNIKAGMTDLEKLDVIAAFPAQYDYSRYYSSYKSMIIAGGGDCWASTSAIVHLCEKVGLPAHVRYGVNDGGAGSGHRNAAVQIGSEVYIAEAGYNQPAPRHHIVYKENVGFDYTVSNGEATIVQYDGFDSNIVVPAELDGIPVTTIGKLAFNYGERYSGVPVKSITLPDTITTLKDQAMESCRSLRSITIPASVTTIGNFVFTDCDNLESIVVAPKNTHYKSSNGVLFDISGKTLLYYPTKGAAKYIVPSGVTDIQDYAFYYTKAVTDITLPTSVSHIGEGAFGDSAVAKVTFTGDLPEIEEYAFHGINATAYYPCSNASWQADSLPQIDGKSVWKKKHKYTKTVKTPTYTEQGYTTHKCDVCGYSYKDSYTSMKKLAQVKISSASNTSTGITIKWNKITGATGYQIYRKSGSATTWGDPIKTITSGSTTNYTDTGRTNGSKYQYKVRAIAKRDGKIVNRGAYSDIKTRYRLTTPTISSATNSGAGKIAMKWNKNASATGYQVKYQIGSGTAKTVKVTSNSTLSKTLSNLSKGSTYKVYVRSYKMVSGTMYCSAYSAYKSVKVTK